MSHFEWCHAALTWISTIFIFSHTTGTIYDKNEKTHEAKNKVFKLHGVILYLTLKFLKKTIRPFFFFFS